MGQARRSTGHGSKSRGLQQRGTLQQKEIKKARGTVAGRDRILESAKIVREWYSGAMGDAAVQGGA